MALIHDIGECIIGDITPFDEVSVEEKYSREEMAVKYLGCTITKSNPMFVDELLTLWYEYEQGNSKPARLVQQLDMLECMQQALIYRERESQDQTTSSMEDFMHFDDDTILPELKPLLDACRLKHEALRSRTDFSKLVIFIIGK